jgi:hypothetical protein
MTKHTCGGPAFGRLKPDICKRCAELADGAEPVRWTKAKPVSYSAHDCGKSRCGPVCTFGEW